MEVVSTNFLPHRINEAHCEEALEGDTVVTAPTSPVSVSGKTWKYRGEGGANLVISLPEEKIILRFPKSKYAGKDQDSKASEVAYYANEIMRPLLGKAFVRPLQIGAVSEEDFDHVRLEAQPFRPLDRCRKDINSRRVIVSPDCVFLTPDYEVNTSGDTFSIEIKPKQGWHSLKATCSVDLCHRCLKQYAKLYKGNIDVISKYCPLDLFSGDAVRMKRAILDLFEHPCNRFKLFKNGDLVYTNNFGTKNHVEMEIRKWFGLPSDSMKKVQVTPTDYLSALVLSALITPIESQKSADVLEDFIYVCPETLPRSIACDTDSQPLPKDCILEKILTLQKHTEISDHDAMKLCEELLNNCEDLEGLHELVLWHPNTKLEQQLSPQVIENIIQLQRFLLSVTAKDVSLLLTFREVMNPSLDISNGAPALHFRAVNKSYRVMISVIDLDPKPVHRISTWVKRKEEWLKIYFDSVNA